MRIESDPKLDFSDVLIKPKRSTLGSRGDVSLERTFFSKRPHPAGPWTGVPIIAANMDTTGTFAMARALAGHRICTALHKHYPVDDLVDFFAGCGGIRDFVFYTLGIGQDDEDKLDRAIDTLGERAPANLCIDIANGYLGRFSEFVARMCERHPQRRILAGNVVTGEMTEQLLLAGADIVKIGIGPGSVCTTRRAAGVGYPQLSAIIECADAAHGLEGLICADGGIQVPGDLGKAYGAGADFVMVGGMLAGHDECDGETAERWVATGELNEDGSPKTERRRFMSFYGMSSEEAMDRYDGGVATHRTSEGKKVLVPHRGPVAGTVQEMLGGMRSTCTYTGSRTLKELSKRTTFVLVNRQLNDKFGGGD